MQDCCHIHEWTAESFQKPLCDCTLWPALYLKTEDLEGQNVDYQWFEIQSIKIENKKETQCELQNRLIFKFSLESYVVIFANFYLGMACSWIFFLSLWSQWDYGKTLTVQIAGSILRMNLILLNLCSWNFLLVFLICRGNR